MKLGALLYNEWRFYRVQPQFWLCLLLALAFAALVNLNPGSIDAQPEKALLLRHSMLLMSIQPLLLAVLAPLAFCRDGQHGISALIDVSAQSLRQRLAVRATGLWLSGMAMQLIFLVMVALVMSKGLPDSSEIWRWSLILLLVQQVPAITLLVALFLWLSRHSQSPLALYLQGAGIWLGYMLLAAATGSPLMANSQSISPLLSQLMLYLDLYALSPLLAQLQQQGAIPAGLLQLEMTFWLNRMLIVSLAAWICWRALRPGTSALPQPEHRRRALSMRSAAQSAAANGLLQNQTQGQYQPCPPGALTFWPVFRGLIQLQWQQLCWQRSTLLALLALCGLIFSEVYTGLGYAEHFSQLLPNSRDAINRVSGDVVPRFGLLLLAFWVYQVAWLNRQQRIDGLIAATPVPSALLLSSQFVVLYGLVLLLVVLSLAAVALAQVLLQVPLDLLEYGQQGLLLVLPLWVWATLLLACHALLRQPLWANLAVAGLLAFGLSPLPAMLQLQHQLWRVGQSQLALPDSLWGYQGALGNTAQTFAGDLSSGGFWPYLLLWALLALSLFALALQFYHRGTGFSRNKLATRLTPLTAGAALCAVLTLMQGGSLHQQLDQAGALQSRDERQAKQAAYERQYQHWQTVPQPMVRQVKLSASLQPQAQQASISATITLHNPHPTAISQLLLGFPRLQFGAELQSLQLQGAQAESIDAALGQQIFTLQPALAPGASIELQIRLELDQPAIAAMPNHQVLRAEFSYLRLLQLLPQLGFVPELRLRDDADRARFGLAALPAAQRQPSVLAAEATPASARYDWAILDTTIAVPVGYQGIAAGTLLNSWQAEGLQFFHYRTHAPVRNLPALIAVPWQQQSSTAAGVPLQIYSPEFNTATDLTMQAMRDTVQWFSQQIGAYPGDALRLVIMPDIGPTGYALPQLVLINHRVGVRAKPSADAPFSQVYRRAAHETAHQWFGHGIGNGVPGDGAFLVESLAKYAELVLLEQRFGRAAMQGLVDYEQQRYARAQAGSLAAASSLIDADESYDQYSRATLVFAKLRAELGDAVIIAALRQLWQQHRYPATPASSMDFVRALRAQSPASAQPLIEQLLLGTDVRPLLAE
ncbi:M1 family aminopeptidase [Rheinheimera sp.]|uniref:M1 family aminopeptidase n=1 Tax=Rheinheimera sp. TaxID=1869214 RepID=UPI003D28F523